MAKSIKNIIISVVIVAILAVGYIFFIKKAPEQPSLVSSSTSVLPGADSTTTGAIASMEDTQTQDFLSVLLNVKSIKLADAIFSKPAFLTLHDSSIILVPDQSAGRPNPFAPIGTDPVVPPVVPVVSEIIPEAPVVTTPIKCKLPKVIDTETNTCVNPKP